MKTVFNNSDLVHVFNLQNQIEGKTPTEGMFFNRTKLYSYGYHYLLAEFLDPQTVFINDSGYSVSTSKHISLVISATSDKTQFFFTNCDTDIVLSTIKNCLNKIPKARKTKDYHINNIETTYKKYIEFLTYNKSLTSKKKDKNHREILKLYKSFSENFENLESSILKAQKEEKEKNKKAIVQKLKDWKSGKIDWFQNNTKTDFLRINGLFVETSQKVKIPIAEAKRLLLLIEQKNIVGQKVDSRFIVNSFNSFLKVGCHNIPLKEINAIKTLLN